MIKEPTIDKLNGLAIVDVVSEYVQLKKSGVNYKGLCPFHDDKNPSFMVSPAKNICHCFVCGKGGNPIHFIMEQEKVDFPEACRILGKKYSIQVEDEKRERTPAEIEEASDEDFKKHPELVRGFIGFSKVGPQREAAGLEGTVRYLADAHVANGSQWVTGADNANAHVMNAVYGRDFKCDGTVEAVQVRTGDLSPDGSGPLSFERGVEIGQVFQLGLKYSNALGLNVLDQNGKSVPVWMGSYGIGVTRVLACIAEFHHDDKGLAWPAAVAPAQVHILAAGKESAAFEAAEKLVSELEERGIEVIFDDRAKVSPGVRINTGFPVCSLTFPATIPATPSWAPGA